MTKVNLLPDYIWEGKRVRRTATLVTLGVVAELVVLGLWFTQKQAALTALEAERDDASAQAAKVDEINSNADAITAKIKPITDKTDYIASVLTHNMKFPRLFERTSMYTTPRVSYRQLQPAVSVLNMTANARTVGDIGRYLLNIQRAKDTFTTVSITSQMPGWSPAAPADGSAGGTTPAGNPFTPSAYTASATAYGGAYRPAAPPGYTTPAGVGGDTVASAGPALLDFTAVGQLTDPFKTTPPVYAGASAGADGTGGATSSYGAYPGGPGGPGAYPSGPSAYQPTGGANGGG